MGVRIVAKGVNAEAFATEYSSPVSRGLEAVHFLNTDLDKALRNYAPGKRTGSIVGTPVAAPNFVTFTGLSNYIITDVDETDNMTFFAVARAEKDGTDQTSRAAFFSNYIGSVNPPGCGLYIQNTNRVSGFACYGNDDISNILTASSVNSTKVVTDWNLYAVVIQPSGVTMRNITTGQSGTVATTVPRRKNMQYKLRIGSSVGTYTGKCDIALLQHHSVVLNETEILAVAADLRAQALRRGIVV